jgi:hypothetical protein
MYRIGRSETDLCRCGKRETTEHLLLNYRQIEIAQARAKLRDEMKGLRLSLRLLLHTKIGIEKTLGFLKETRLCTRKWHFERGQEEIVNEVEEEGEVREVGKQGKQEKQGNQGMSKGTTIYNCCDFPWFIRARPSVSHRRNLITPFYKYL